ncbi:EnvZ/OmpR regulon moderator MzrA [Escherichia coli]|nr:EnvZ/OmpR regulon moderator MzrA [Escherichia coli]
MQIPRMSLRQLPVRRCFTSGQHTIAGWSEVRQQESTLAIRAVHQGTTMPDGFQSGITLTLTAFLSKVSPQNDTLLITFDSSDQSAAAKAVLDRTLPHGYIIAQQDNNSQAMQWLTRLRITSSLRITSCYPKQITHFGDFTVTVYD